MELNNCSYRLVSFVIKNGDKFSCYKSQSFLNQKYWVSCLETVLLNVEDINNTINQCYYSVELLCYVLSGSNIPNIDKDIIQFEPVDMTAVRPSVSISVPQEEIDGRTAVMSTIDSQQETNFADIPVPLRGIRNTFSNCYLSSCFQCLSVIPGVLQKKRLFFRRWDAKSVYPVHD